tara:strand:- start:178 stop:774 length:597 start_codon:yes stop_codon:yes gene_type:complete
MSDNLLQIPEKYKNINDMFYKQLYEDNISDNEEDNIEICYITGDNLQEDKIELTCKHKFNYLPLYCEIVRQKTVSNSYNNLTLKVNQIQCPYCRNIQNNILPSNNNCKPVYGVNYPHMYTMKPDKCSYVYKSGGRKNNICQEACYGMYCKTHIKYINISSTTFRCSAILKNGPNKGNKCKCKVSNQNEYCKRHKNSEK